MDRQTVYPGAIPLETDLLNTNKNAMIGLAKLAAAIMGSGTMLNGLACTPDNPASLNVRVAPGEIYSLQNVDGTAYSSLAADTTHSILKQGIMLDGALLPCPAPATNGYSIAYLVQVAYQDVDANAVVLPYYNASNPAQAYSGPDNSGSPDYTCRKGVCAVAVKAGVAAATGSQTAPAPDPGYTGIFSVSVAYGQTQIGANNISAISGAPFINSTILGRAPAFLVSPTAPTPDQFDNSKSWRRRRRCSGRLGVSVPAFKLAHPERLLRLMSATLFRLRRRGRPYRYQIRIRSKQAPLLRFFQTPGIGLSQVRAQISLTDRRQLRR